MCPKSPEEALNMLGHRTDNEGEFAKKGKGISDEDEGDLQTSFGQNGLPCTQPTEGWKTGKQLWREGSLF